MKTAAIIFIGLTPGYPPFGREPLFKMGRVTLRRTDLAAMDLDVPVEVEGQINQSLQDWNNSAPCDDNLKAGFNE